MDFTLSDEQTEIAELAARLFGDLCTPDALRAHEESGEATPAKLWSALADADLLGIALPEPAGGTSVTQLAVPPPPVDPFHRELADALLSGVPMSVTPEGSRRGVAVMEAATRSARDGGSWVPVAL